MANYFLNLLLHSKHLLRDTSGSSEYIFVQGIYFLAQVSAWKLRLEMQGNDTNKLIKRHEVAGGHFARGMLLVVRKEQLVQIIPDSRWRWVPVEIVVSRNRWQSC